MLSCSGEGLYPGIAGDMRGWLDLSEWHSHVNHVSIRGCGPPRQVVKTRRPGWVSYLEAWGDKGSFNDMLPESHR